MDMTGEILFLILGTFAGLYLSTDETINRELRIIFKKQKK